MKKEIGIVRFVISIYILLVIISVVIAFPFNHMPNIADIVPLFVREILSVTNTLISLLIALFVVVKRYILPASPMTIAVWSAITSFFFLNLFVIALYVLLSMLGGPMVIARTLLVIGSNLFASANVTSIVKEVIIAVLYGIVIYFALRFFLQRKIAQMKIESDKVS